MGLIYKLTFSNGKVYIGMTRVSLRKRLYCHAFKSKAEKPKLPVHRAWKLHGEPASEILAIVENPVLGETRKGMRAGIPKSAETRLRMSKSRKGKSNGREGSKHSQETKNKMAEVRKLYWTKDRRSKLSEFAVKRDRGNGGKFQ